MWQTCVGNHVISIHAPPRGATIIGIPRGRRWQYFNSRPSARGDGDCNMNILTRKISIHAPPRGATLTQQKKSKVERISIHAPPRGATGKTLRIGARTVRFQFTPLREGRQRIKELDELIYHFNSRPSARGDLSSFLSSVPHQLFQFTPLREGRPGTHRNLEDWEVFQFTPLREGRRAE